MALSPVIHDAYPLHIHKYPTLMVRSRVHGVKEEGASSTSKSDKATLVLQRSQVTYSIASQHMLAVDEMVQFERGKKIQQSRRNL